MSIALVKSCEAEIFEKALEVNETDTAEEVFEAVISRNKFLQVNKHIEDGRLFFSANIIPLNDHISLEDGVKAGYLMSNDDQCITLHFIADGSKNSIFEIVKYVLDHVV